jgi:hypothetical protein
MWWLLLAVQAVLAIADPFGFRYLGPLIVIVQVGALLVIAGVALVIPSIVSLARDRSTRIAHGLEHATIHVLGEMGVEVLSGWTGETTFQLELDNDSHNWDRYHDIIPAALDAVERINAGQREIAYSPYCGTSWLVGHALWALAVLAAGVTSAILGAPTGIRFAGIVAAAFFARLAKHPLGLAAQRWLTVATDFVTLSRVRVARELIAAGKRIAFTVTLEGRARGSRRARSAEDRLHVVKRRRGLDAAHERVAEHLLLRA